MKEGNRDPKRWAIGLVSVGFILFMWIQKDIAGIYCDLPAEQAAAMIATTVAVMLLKGGGIAVGIWLLRRIIGRFSRKKRQNEEQAGRQE